MSLKIWVDTGVFRQKLSINNQVKGIGSENQLRQRQGLTLPHSLLIHLSSLSICKAGVGQK